MRTILFVLLSLVPALAHADDHFGVIGGVNFANLRGTGDGADWQGYFMGGVYADFGISEDSFITPQLRYNRKGASASDTITGGVYDLSLAIKYIELPVYFKYKFPGGTTFRPNLFVGPNFGLKVGDSVSIKNRSTGQQFTASGSVNGMRSYDLALDAGAGIEFTLSESTVASFNASYSYGLININKDGSDKIKTQGIQVYAGIGF